MAIPAQPCACSPYSNICCCGTQNGITVVQPQCQNLPDGSVVNNPAFVFELNTSFWTYKFLTDCNSATRGISNFGIPICAEINAANIVVEEKIDGCGLYAVVPFELIKNDPNFGPAPNGFQYLKVETNNRFDKGLSVEYRIGIIGNYTEEAQSVKIKAAGVVYTFGCTDCFIVPGCNPAGKLLLSKQCGKVIVNNQATLQFVVHVDNIGDGALDLVQFNDIIVIPTQFTIGPVTVNPSTLSVVIRTGQVEISGNLGTIEPGGRVTVTYFIPVLSFSNPGSYSVANMARVAATGTESSVMCKTTLDVVKLSAGKCCTVNGNNGTFNLTIAGVGDSPDVIVDIFDRMRIPTGITVQFSSFNGCEAYYTDTQTPIPLNVNLAGPIGIEIICKNALVPSGGSFVKSISYTLVSSAVVGTTSIANSIVGVTPLDLGNIIYEGIDNLPAVASISVELVQGCNTPCD
ncbi:MAG TPA: hypothetical protein PK629_12095 [Oscillospiraceae bacterium]|nr:hypothetical protein [Oscillospiraceae bacterium]HPF55023.1 hypothetical protein [Clostridiales bacterium]HPK35909.1 hypothetical protein [Oscillospiraceae bacterium]HPR76932.1 hypothetical protein [Oscillospiraceae bacterium]